MAQQAAASKRCEWNRYCGYVGPFHGARALAIGSSRPSTTLRCYACGGYVCNRCAGREMYLAAGPVLMAARIATLVCPADGQPLGQDGAWMVHGARGWVSERLTAPPTAATFCEALAGPELEGERAIRERIGEALSALDRGAAGEAARRAAAAGLDAGRFGTIAQVLRRLALEREGRFDEAWEVQRELFDADRDALLVSAGLVRHLAPGGGQLAEAIVSELMAMASRPLERVFDRALDRLRHGETSPPEMPDTARRGRRPAVVAGEVSSGAASPVRPVRLSRHAAAPIWSEIGSPASGSPAAVEPSSPYSERAAAYCSQCAAALPDLEALLGSHDAARIGETLAAELRAAGAPSIELRALVEAVLQACESAMGFSAARKALAAFFARCRLFVVEASGGVAFCHPHVREVFEARWLTRRLFSGERPDFKEAGRSGVTQAVAEMVAAALDADRVARLHGWQRTSRERRSVFRGADLVVLARNLALVRLAWCGEVRGLDLSEADFSALQLDGADFSEANLEGASFRGASLRGAIFRGAVLDGASFDGADLFEASIDIRAE